MEFSFTWDATSFRLHTVTEYYRLDRKAPVTAALVAANTIIYVRPTFLHSILPTINQHKDLKRFFLSALYHLNGSHLFYNMLTSVEGDSIGDINRKCRICIDSCRP
uniref:Uncharacterized protein n=1 Tax=Solanum lycopersicum TaxID=4081 RepID=A0A3Q7HAP9_SOLLC